MVKSKQIEPIPNKDEFDRLFQNVEIPNDISECLLKNKTENITSDTPSIAVAINTVYTCTTENLRSLTITSVPINSGNSVYYKSYIFFTSAANTPTIYFPDTLQWMNGILPVIKANTFHVLIIWNNTAELRSLSTIGISAYGPLPTGFVIDQRGTISNSDTMVSDCYMITDTMLTAAKNGTLNYNDVVGKLELKLTNSIDNYNNTISRIRKHMHLYCGQWDGLKMRLKQLDDENKKTFADSSDATNYVTGVNDTEDYTYDTWLKFANDIYYQCFPLVPENGENVDSDLVLVVFSLDIPDDYQNWDKFDSNTLIGVYKAKNVNNKLRSISGVNVTNHITQTNSKAYARARGAGFKLIDYNAHKFIAHLFYAYYSTLNSQAKCGSGTVNVVNSLCYPKQTGLCDNLGLVDTTNTTNQALSGNGTVSSSTEDGQAEIIAGYGEHIKSVNCFGLENWWGDIYEWMDDLNVMYAKNSKQPGESGYSRTPDNYVDDYIRKYIEDNPESTSVNITIDGVDTPVTLAEILEYPQAQRFIRVADINNNTIRIIQTPFTANFGDYPKKMYLGKHGDLIPKAGGAGSTTYYADTCYVSSAGVVAVRSNYSIYAYGGVAYLDLSYSNLHSSSFIGSRLLYEGNSNTVEIVNTFNQ